jgi:hypothetical protein
MSAANKATGERKKKKGPAPAHQNKFAFYHNKNSSKTQAIMDTVRWAIMSPQFAMSQTEQAQSTSSLQSL